LTQLVARHEILRTTIANMGDQPAQVIAPPAPFTLPIESFEHLAAEQQAAAVQEWATRDARKPFDMERGPLLRAHLLRLAADQHVLAITMHHIITDGWSIGVLVRELAALYQAHLNDPRSHANKREDRDVSIQPTHPNEIQEHDHRGPEQSGSPELN